MKYLSPLLISFVLALSGRTQSASIPTYELEENIKSNLIDDSIEGLDPPKNQAQDHYGSTTESSFPKIVSPYVVEISRKYIKLKTTGLAGQTIALTKNETEGIQKLTLAFVELLNSSKLSSQDEEEESESPDWSNVNPVMTLTNTGISLEFLNEPEDDVETVETPEKEKNILWDFLGKYAKNIFRQKLKDLNIPDSNVILPDSPFEEISDDSLAFQRFLDSMWRLMKLSVDYAESNFKDWTTSIPETTTPEHDEITRTVSATLFAYEEFPSFHIFPSQEFEKRRKDIDSIFYGRGII